MTIMIMQKKKKKTSLFIFIDRGKALFGLWEKNNVFQSTCESVVGALILEVFNAQQSQCSKIKLDWKVQNIGDSVVILS